MSGQRHVTDRPRAVARGVLAAAAALVLAVPALLALPGCQEKVAREQHESEMAKVRRERDELSRQLDDAQNERRRLSKLLEQANQDLRMAEMEADQAKRGGQEATAELRRLTADAARLAAENQSLQFKVDSLQVKNEADVKTRDTKIALLARQLADLRGGEAATSQPNVMDLLGSAAAPHSAVAPPPTTQPK